MKSVKWLALLGTLPACHDNCPHEHGKPRRNLSPEPRRSGKLCHMRIVPPMVALLALGACASPAGLRQGRPVLDETTAKRSERVAGCIGDKLDAQNSTLSQIRYSTRPTSNGYSISGDQTGLVLWGGTDTILLIDISNTGDETRVKMYTHFLVGDGPAAYFDLVRGCI